jgi:hypothetical protein
MSHWSWKEGFQFVLGEELISKEELASTYKMNPTEKFGSQLLRPLFRTINLISKHIREPLAICLFTMLAALFSLLVFYNIPAFVILGNLFSFKAVRCLLFLYVELNLFAMGCRAFGRFNNKTLVELWKGGRLVAIFPGDNKARK